MHTSTLHEAHLPLRRVICAWQAGAIGLLLLSSLYSEACAAALMDAREQLREQATQLQQAEEIRDRAVRELGEMILQAEQPASAETEACEAEETYTYTYIGECVITAYCPCEECCGQWADGLTATGVPAAPGIVAVDPEVIPLGSTVIIGGREYLAADAGVRGQAVDICMAEHQAAVEFGVQTADVWAVIPEGGSD